MQSIILEIFSRILHAVEPPTSELSFAAIARGAVRS
jgi:hypothetical protein